MLSLPAHAASRESPFVPPLLPLLLLSLALLHASATAAELSYSAFEAEVASEYRVGDAQFGPSYLRLRALAEITLSDEVTAKAIVSPCVGRYSSDPTGVTQCAKSRVLEELTLSGFADRYDFSLGRQVITLGNTEGFILLDRFNGRDFCRFARLDTDNKLPNWIANGRAFFGDATLSLTFAPFSAKAEIPDPESYCNDEFNDPGRFSELDDPDNDSIEAWAGALELALTRDSWSGTLNLMSTRESLFVIESVPTFSKTRPRTLWLGGSAAATLGDYVLRGELIYAPERDFSLSPEAVAVQLTQGVATNGVEERSNLLSVIGLEARNNDWYWALQYYDDRVESGAALTRKEQLQMMSLRVRRTFSNERLSLDAFSVLDIDYRDFAVRTLLSYELSDQTRIEVGGTAYADFGDRPGLFGSYEGRESLFAKLRQIF